MKVRLKTTIVASWLVIVVVVHKRVLMFYLTASRHHPTVIGMFAFMYIETNINAFAFVSKINKY